jgi:hypothetical protein
MKLTRKPGGGRKKATVPSVRMRVPENLVDKLDKMESLILLLEEAKETVESNSSPRYYHLKKLVESVEALGFYR